MSRRTLQDRRALVTGASGGIGRALALELARRGAHLVLVARREEKLRALATEIENLGRRAVIVAGDITEAATRARALAAARDELGGLDLLVNNAGVSAHGRFHEAAPERLRTIMEVNFFAAAELTRAAAPLLQQGRRPMVVNIGSILGHRGIPHNSEYCASKFALRGWSEALRAEFSKLGIDLLLVSPGTTDTEFFDHLIDKRGEVPWTQEKGVPAETVARATVRAIERGRREIIPSRRGRLLTRLSRFLPGLLDRVMARYG
jgi:short-subunit dehydrogenase